MIKKSVFFSFLMFGLSAHCIAENDFTNGHGVSSSRVDHGEGEPDKHNKHNKHNEHNEHNDHGSSKAIGPGKAITAVDEALGFKLSAEAFKTLGINLEKIPSGRIKVDKTALVRSKSTCGLYRYRDGFFKFVPVQIEQSLSSHYIISTKELRQGDQIAVSSVGLLLVTEVYSTDESEYGHSH